jgi:zinc protease
VMVVAGNVELEEVKRLSEKWFGPIPAGDVPKRNLPREPKQTQARKLTIEADVPQDAFYTVFHMPGRDSVEYYTADLLSDILGRGKSARLYTELVKEKELFIDLQAYVTGSIDPGLMVIGGRLSSGISFQQAEEEVWRVINEVKKGVENDELQKVKNQAESSIVFGELELLNRAMNLAYGAILGNPNWVNEEIHHIRKVTNENIVEMASRILVPENSSTVYYKSASK